MKNLVISNLRYLRHKPWPLAGQLRTQISVSFTPIQAVPLHSTVSINFFSSFWLPKEFRGLRSTRFQKCRWREWNHVQMSPRHYLPIFFLRPGVLIRSPTCSLPCSISLPGKGGETAATQVMNSVSIWSITAWDGRLLYVYHVNCQRLCFSTGRY